MTRKTEYQFTAVPTQLFLCMDNNCRSTLFSIIQLSTYYENKSGAPFDGWFFRSNALLEEETNLSKNVLNGALDALYQAGIVDIIPQAKGKGKAQGARKYKVNYETFLKYQEIPFEECSCSHPDFGIVTLNYKNGTPSFQQRQHLEKNPKCGKSDNNIDIIDNTEIIDNRDKIEKIDIKNKETILSNNTLNSNCCHFEDRIEFQKEEESDKEKNLHSKDMSVTALEGFTSNASYFLETETTESVQAPEEPNPVPPSPSITAEFINSQIPFVYSRVKRLGAGGEPDNYTDAANDILDEYGKEVSNWISCVKSKTMYSGSAMTRLVEIINEQPYENQDECERTALNLMDYAAQKDAQYAKELYSVLKLDGS